MLLCRCLCVSCIFNDSVSVAAVEMSGDSGSGDSTLEVKVWFLILLVNDNG